MYLISSETMKPYTVSVTGSQGSKGDVGLPGPQGPVGTGVAGPPVRHKCIFLHVHMGIQCHDVILSNTVSYLLTHRVETEPPALKDCQELMADL